MFTNLRDQAGNLVTHPKEVLNIFTSFYKDLLSSPQTQSRQISKLWLDDIQLHSLNAHQIESLNAPWTDSEIINIIPLKPPLLPVQMVSYYKTCATLLAPNLSKLFNHILDGNYFPDEMLLAA